jgi:hypothetical protein
MYKHANQEERDAFNLGMNLLECKTVMMLSTLYGAMKEVPPSEASNNTEVQTEEKETVNG